MAKYNEIQPGDGVTHGQTGLVVRGILNNMMSGEAFYVPEDFNFLGDLSGLANRTWVITYEHTLSANLVLPPNVILFFDGGKILGTSKITGNMTIIQNLRNLHIFSLTITFDGTWTETEISPQAFGAITSPHPNWLPVDGAVSTSPMIQKVFDTPFLPKFTNGYYYIDAPTIITRPVTADFGSIYETMSTADRITGRVWRNDHIRFYTDQDINFWEYRTHGIFLKGGVMDTRNCPTWDSAIYYVHCDYGIFQGECSGYGVGTKANVRRLGSKGKYFHWDCHNATKNWGYMCQFRILGETTYIAEGIIIEDPQIARENVTGTWANMFYADTFFNGCKKALEIHTHFNHLKVHGQDQAVATAIDRHDPIVIVRSDEGTGLFDVRIEDLLGIEEPEGSGYYYHTANSAYSILSDGILWSGSSQRNTTRNRYTNGRPMQAQYSINPTQSVIILSRVTSYSSFISDIHNILPIIAKRGTFTARAYQAGSINFETDLLAGETYSLTPSTDITLVNVEQHLFKPRGKYTSYTVSQATTDFIELRLQSSGFRGHDFYLLISDATAKFAMAQLILTTTGGTVTSEIWDRSKFKIFGNTFIQFNKGNTSVYSEVILRLIGFPEITGSGANNNIQDFATIDNPNTSFQFAHRLDGPSGSMHLLMNQTGTNPPEVVTYIDTMTWEYTPSYTREGVGHYRINYNHQFYPDNTLPVSQVLYTPLGRIELSATHSHYFTIRTYDLNDQAADGILVNQPIIINKYWNR